MEEILSRRFPLLPDVLEQQLKDIPPSNYEGLLYYPCLVTLKDGNVRDFVYLAQSPRWLQSWAPLPDRPLGERFIDIRDVVAVKNSPNRLPPDFANRLYAAGESGMGYTIFTVRFRNGSTTVFVGGNAIDFIVYPTGMSAPDVIEVLPHVGRNDPMHQKLPYFYWAIFEREVGRGNGNRKFNLLSALRRAIRSA